ncbi:MAG: pyridoxal 5'-phosphate synthase glutaminase subunit PdxT [bacterium]|nr:pyridoxal 5'-phosphate synthase glutaminase subunit PdxT [bacterium]
MRLRIGILALQGDFVPHAMMLKRLNAESRLVRKASDLIDLDGLILPGGESTTMTRLIEFASLHQPILTLIASGIPVWGTCAGTILLGKQGTDPRVRSLEAIDIEVARNAYGRQSESFHADVIIRELETPFEGIFIRAPKIVSIGDSVQVKGKFNDEIVFVEQNNVWASTFHPELTSDVRIHQLFLKFCEEKKR